VHRRRVERQGSQNQCGVLSVRYARIRRLSRKSHLFDMNLGLERLVRILHQQRASWFAAI